MYLYDRSIGGSYRLIKNSEGVYKCGKNNNKYNKISIWKKNGVKFYKCSSLEFIINIKIVLWRKMKNKFRKIEKFLWKDKNDIEGGWYRFLIFFCFW